MNERNWKREWTSTFTLTVLLAILVLTALYVDRNRNPGGLLEKTRIFTVILAVSFSSILLALRKKTSRWLTVSIFSIVFVWILCMGTVYHFEHISSDKPWLPFMGHKLVFFCLSLLVCGPYWVNALWMGIFAAQVLVFWFTTPLAEAAICIHEWEPIYTFFFAIVGGTLLWFRSYNERVLQWLAAEKSRRKNLEALSRIFVSIRDIANTPLQNLILALTMLSNKSIDVDDATKTMSSATERLSSLNKIYKNIVDNTQLKGTHPMTESEILDFIEKMKLA